ncbi:MauE/DoxX family redox-associated membrane protein [Sphingobacterium wenxiniae]|nr:MauE/DoxX family redox-associated membrane protein [Sphingobacterium wenxiniae]
MNYTSIELIRLLLIMLWVYAAFVKLGNMEANFDAMQKQIFSKPVANILAYTVPISELLAVVFLLIRIRTGFLLSITLLSAFSLYIGLILLHVFGDIPCSCGGIFQGMGHKTHLFFNISMLLIAILGLIIYDRIKGKAENLEKSRH